MTRSSLPRRAALVALLALSASAAVPLHAQAAAPVEPSRPRHGWMRPAKWIALGAAAAIAGYAVTRTGAADDAYDDLRRSCTRAPAGCALDAGSYVDPAVERLYDSAVRNDRRAQIAIVGGQTVLLTAATLFVLDLRTGEGPANIPYPTTSRSCAAARCFLIARLAF